MPWDGKSPTTSYKPTSGEQVTRYVDANGVTRDTKTDLPVGSGKEWWQQAGSWMGDRLGGGPDKNAQVKRNLNDNILRGNPYVGDSSSQGQWISFLNQLRDQSEGRGPSLAEQQYRQANMDQSAAIGSLGRSSGRPGAVRAAIQQQSRMGQGLAAGSMQARLAEQQAAQGMYGSALNNSSNFELQRQLANASAYQNMVRIALGKGDEKSQFEKYAGYAAQAAQVYAMLA